MDDENDKSDVKQRKSDKSCCKNCSQNKVLKMAEPNPAKSRLNISELR